jgi:hypothetical protein
MWVSSEEDIGNEFVISVNEPEQRNSVSSAFERSHGIRDNVDRTDLTREFLWVWCYVVQPILVVQMGGRSASD